MKKTIILTEKQLDRLLEYTVQPNVASSTSVKNLYNKPLSFDKFKLESKKSPLNVYLSSRPELIPIYKDIEKVLNDKFTSDHFEKEKKYSGGLKPVSYGLSKNAKTMFNKLLNKYGLKGKVKVSNNSYRDYQKQKETFIEMAKKHGGKIKHGLRQAALPGFSQHHTGKAFDISPSELVTDQMLQAFNFKRPYKTDTGFRMPEPWHIIYTG